MSDWRATLRQLRRAPVHVATVTLSLGIGMAVCGAVFSALNVLLFAAVPGVVEREELVRIRWVSGGGTLTPTEFAGLTTAARAEFDGIVAQGDRFMPVTLPSGPASVQAAFVSPEFFSTVGTTPLQGRLLTPEDGLPGATPAVVMGEALWRKAFASNPEVLGQSLSIGGQSFVVVGVAPRRFAGLHVFELATPSEDGPGLWLPLGANHPHLSWLSVAARSKPGRSVRDMQDALAQMGERLEPLSPSSHQPPRLQVFRAGLDWRKNPWDSMLSVGIFLMVPLAVLAVGCANVANLQLARATERTRELSVRLAVGASRFRLFRLLGLEIACLALLAGAIGWIGASVLLAQARPLVAVPLALDVRVVSFFATLVLLVIAMVGLTPAWLSSREVIASGWRERAEGISRKRLRAALVVLQIAVSVVLVFVTALGTRTLQVLSPSLPADADRIFVADVNLADVHPGGTLQTRLFVETVLSNLEANTAIRAAGAATFFRTGEPMQYRLTDDPPDTHRTAFAAAVTPGWFDAAAIRFLAGRGFGASADASDVIVNDALARELGAGASVLGRHVQVSRGAEQPRVVRVIGIVENPLTASIPAIYFAAHETRLASSKHW